ncbi:MAG: DUF86 domain-containing protein [Bacillus sp. (in: firmicutes)]
MYFVDRQKIERNIVTLEKHIKIFQEAELLESDITKLALERLTQVLADCVLDVGNAIIDGFIMRDPGSYDDIIDILLDEKVITKEMEQQFKCVLPLRKTVVQDYMDIDHTELLSVLRANIDAFEQFPERVLGYLENELGPVSAFRR